jgi:hypothetical protein
MSRQITNPAVQQAAGVDIKKSKQIKNNASELKLYSLSQAAKAMSIGRDSLRLLMAVGKIGYLKIGETKKISHQELLRFQIENTIHKVEPRSGQSLSDQDINKLLDKPTKQRDGTMGGIDILNKIIRKDRYGNSKN